ncbi:MAG TPA: YqzE family protein [Bacilli bacterium]|uniref:YqzE family protein n=1 Tax=Amphibacillus indicireducens TaxID=1076330 RepID=A0ABP7VG28_9BACI|nr:YqzE family protein [Bacilli bacterium]
MADQTFIEFIIDLTLDHYQKPKAEREKLKEERKQLVYSPYSHKWFGLFPSTIRQLRAHNQKKQVKTNPASDKKDHR